eukprot:TRINITY_DN408_c0_g1_i2.p1 TRINITY_DN408_c0_g1~~TRINITY_DN408_c0_g1_i2.p1  ORF type:complete len:110 (-),score=10.57 TRINITY_DN408_c0_g1_i2:544-873(-)
MYILYSRELYEKVKSMNSQKCSFYFLNIPSCDNPSPAETNEIIHQQEGMITEPNNTESLITTVHTVMQTLPLPLLDVVPTTFQSKVEHLGHIFANFQFEKHGPSVDKTR